MLELLLVLVIMSLAAALAGPSIGRMFNDAQAKSIVKKLSAVFNHARVLAIRERQNHYTVISDGKIILTSRSSGIRKEIPIPEDVTVQGPEIVFYPGGGSSGGVFVVSCQSTGSRFVAKVEPSDSMLKVTAFEKKMI